MVIRTCVEWEVSSIRESPKIKKYHDGIFYCSWIHWETTAAISHYCLSIFSTASLQPRRVRPPAPFSQPLRHTNDAVTAHCSGTTVGTHSYHFIGQVTLKLVHILCHKKFWILVKTELFLTIVKCKRNHHFINMYRYIVYKQVFGIVF